MNQTLDSAASDGQTNSELTVGKHLDNCILRARKHLEELCITKAKAEAAQMLNVPMSFVHSLYGNPF